MTAMPASRFALVLMLAVLPLAILAACNGASEGHDENISVIDVRGRVKAVEAGGMRLIVRHEEMPGYMQAMTMPFALREPMGAEVPRPGDAIAFRYVLTDSSSWIEDVRQLDAETAATLKLEEEPAIVAATEGSIYQVDDRWTDDRGRSVRLAELSGRPVMLSMIFTNCSYACPMIVTDMKRIAAQLPEDLRDDVRYVLVSLDPERDTPEAMRGFAEAYGLSDSWRMLRGDADQVRMLAAMLGIRYRQQSDGQFAHTSLISILDRNGEIVHRQQGIGTNGDASAVLMDLLAENAGAKPSPNQTGSTTS